MARLHESLPRDLYHAWSACCVAASEAAEIHRVAANLMQFHLKEGEAIPASTATAFFADSVVSLHEKFKTAQAAFDAVEADLYNTEGETCANSEALWYARRVQSAVILIPDLFEMGFAP